MNGQQHWARAAWNFQAVTPITVTVVMANQLLPITILELRWVMVSMTRWTSNYATKNLYLLDWRMILNSRLIISASFPSLALRIKNLLFWFPSAGTISKMNQRPVKPLKTIIIP